MNGKVIQLNNSFDNKMYLLICDELSLLMVGNGQQFLHQHWKYSEMLLVVSRVGGIFIDGRTVYSQYISVGGVSNGTAN